MPPIAYRIWATALLILTACGLPASAANLVLNPSFEADTVFSQNPPDFGFNNVITNWGALSGAPGPDEGLASQTTNGGSIVWDNGTVPGGGVNTAIIARQGGITQTVAGFAANTTYTLQLYANANANISSGGAIEVTLDGTLLIPSTPVPPVGGTNVFNLKTATFVTTSSGSKVLLIRQSNSAGANFVALDLVSIDVAATDPIASLSPLTGLDFGMSTIDYPTTRGLNITNVGGGTLTVSAATATGPAAANFTALTPLPLNVPSGQSRTLVVSYLSASVATSNATLQLTTNAPGQTTLNSPLTARAVDQITLLNPSFEVDPTTATTITGWTVDASAGFYALRVPATGGYTSGAVPDGNQVFEFFGGGWALRQKIGGFRPGMTVRIGLSLASSNNSNVQNFTVRLGGLPLFGTLTPVAAPVPSANPGDFATPWTRFTEDLVINQAGELEIDIRPTEFGPMYLLIDHLTVQELVNSVKPGWDLY